MTTYERVVYRPEVMPRLIGHPRPPGDPRKRTVLLEDVQEEIFHSQRFLVGTEVGPEGDLLWFHNASIARRHLIPTDLVVSRTPMMLNYHGTLVVSRRAMTLYQTSFER